MTTQSTWTDDLEDTLLGLAPYAIGAAALAVGVCLAALALILQPAWLAQLQTSLAGVEPKAYWYFALQRHRRLHIVVDLDGPGAGHHQQAGARLAGRPHLRRPARAYQFAGPGLRRLPRADPARRPLHRLHPAAIAGTVRQHAYRPLWVGLGQLSLYLLAFAVSSFYLRAGSATAPGAAALRQFGVFALALLHGLFSGTDSGLAWISRPVLGQRAERGRPDRLPPRQSRARRAAATQRINRAGEWPDAPGPAAPRTR